VRLRGTILSTLAPPSLALNNYFVPATSSFSFRSAHPSGKMHLLKAWMGGPGFAPRSETGLQRGFTFNREEGSLRQYSAKFPPGILLFAFALL